MREKKPWLNLTGTWPMSAWPGLSRQMCIRDREDDDGDEQAVDGDALGHADEDYGFAEAAQMCIRDRGKAERKG